MSCVRTVTGLSPDCWLDSHYVLPPCLISTTLKTWAQQCSETAGTLCQQPMLRTQESFTNGLRKLLVQNRLQVGGKPCFRSLWGKHLHYSLQFVWTRQRKHVLKDYPKHFKLRCLQTVCWATQLLEILKCRRFLLLPLTSVFQLVYFHVNIKLF